MPPRLSGVDILFEASVGGGIPIIGPLKHSLTSNEITSVMGIVNGTTNYMLTRMAEDGLDYDEALAEAQALGFAEADPTADVDGLDAAAKIAILASIAFNSRVVMSQVPAEGIRATGRRGHRLRAEMGYAIKLLAIARRTDSGIDVRVHPTMIPDDHPLASVNGVYNAIYVVGDAVGETMFFGEGAGSLPAASAVVGDVIEVARRIQADNCTPLVGCTCTETLSVRDTRELETALLRAPARCRQARRAGRHGEGVRRPRGLDRVGHPEGRTESWTSGARLRDAHGAGGRCPRCARRDRSLDVVERVASLIRVEDL